MQGRRIFVSNLSFETQWKYLKDHMRKCGDVIRVDIFQDEKGRSKGCGVVEFSSRDDCSRGLKELD
jgi:RNA recognition motif-containing protein